MSLQMRKQLSPNDLGITGSHQAGVLVPKEPELQALLPSLDPSLRNPRYPLQAFDRSGRSWCLVYVYYNSRRFGGTRDEYRITRLTRFFRGVGASPGDDLVMVPRTGQPFVYDIDVVSTHDDAWASASDPSRPGRIKLSGTWTVVKY